MIVVDLIACRPDSDPRSDSSTRGSSPKIASDVSSEWCSAPARGSRCTQPSAHPEGTLSARIAAVASTWTLSWSCSYKTAQKILSKLTNKQFSSSHLRSNVLQFECGRAGLCGGKLRGPSMLRDMMELRSDDSLSLALKVEVVIVVDTPLLTVHREFGWLEPGVLDVERWFFGDDGAEPTVFRD